MVPYYFWIEHYYYGDRMKQLFLTLLFCMFSLSAYEVSEKSITEFSLRYESGIRAIKQLSDSTIVLISSTNNSDDLVKKYRILTVSSIAGDTITNYPITPPLGWDDRICVGSDNRVYLPSLSENSSPLLTAFSLRGEAIDLLEFPQLGAIEHKHIDGSNKYTFLYYNSIQSETVLLPFDQSHNELRLPFEADSVKFYEKQIFFWGPVDSSGMATYYVTDLSGTIQKSNLIKIAEHYPTIANGWFDPLSGSVVIYSQFRQAVDNPYEMVCGTGVSVYDGDGTPIVNDTIHSSPFGYRISPQDLIFTSDSVPHLFTFYIGYSPLGNGGHHYDCHAFYRDSVVVNEILVKDHITPYSYRSIDTTYHGTDTVISNQIFESTLTTSTTSMGLSTTYHNNDTLVSIGTTRDYTGSFTYLHKTSVDQIGVYQPHQTIHRFSDILVRSSIPLSDTTIFLFVDSGVDVKKFGTALLNTNTAEIVEFKDLEFTSIGAAIDNGSTIVALYDSVQQRERIVDISSGIIEELPIVIPDGDIIEYGSTDGGEFYLLYAFIDSIGSALYTFNDSWNCTDTTMFSEEVTSITMNSEKVWIAKSKSTDDSTLVDITCFTRNGGELWRTSMGSDDGDKIFSINIVGDSLIAFSGYTNYVRSGHNYSMDMWQGIIGADGTLLYDKANSNTGTALLPWGNDALIYTTYSEGTRFGVNKAYLQLVQLNEEQVENLTSEFGTRSPSITHSSGKLQIQIPEISGAVQVSLYNLLGQEIFTQEVISSGISEITLPNVAAGIYPLRISGSVNMTAKIIVK